MRCKLAVWIVLLGVLGVAGCTSNHVTNMTPKVVKRNSDGWYTLEARWSSNQRTVRQETMTPYVIIGTDFHPMHRTPLTTNRWEVVVPAAPGQRFLNYRFKFDYLYDAFGPPRADSKLSPTYQMEIVD